jgi:Xaa-Pro aminopeptidase
MRYPAIQNNFFVQNRQKLSKQLEPGSVALLFASYQMPRNGDQYHTYRQHSDFFFLTGIEQEKSILLLSPDAKTKEMKEILFILRTNKTLEIWEGHKLTFDEASNISGINTIRLIDDFESTLNLLVPDCQHIYFNLSELPKFKPEVKLRDEFYLEYIKEKYPLHKYERMAPLLQKIRLIKSEIEIDLIKKASAITKDAFLRVLSNLKPGMMEFEVEALISYEFIRQGAEGHAYAPIVAGGKNACALHYIENDNPCNQGELLLMDFGAEFAHYAADLSRTVPIGGKFSSHQKKLYKACFRVFNFAKSQMKPGTTINKFHAEVCKYWEEEHIQLGLYTKEEAKKHKGENAKWFDYYMHGTSHFLGLDVHDVGTKDTVFEPGMVLTCEPGIYLENEGIGIRIENDILITKEGNEDLMADIPINADEIENLMTNK